MDAVVSSAKESDEVFKQVLAIVRQVWPRRFPYEDEQSQIHLFRRACRGISLDCVIEAAEEYVVGNQYAPTPAALGGIARKLHQQKYPTKYIEPPLAASPLPDDLIGYRHTVEQRLTRINQRAAWAWKKLDGDKEAVAQYFALLWSLAPTPEAVAAIQNGEVDKPTMLDALQRYRNGERGKDIPKTPRSAPPQPDADVPVAKTPVYAG